MPYVAALYSQGRIVTGSNHGVAFGKLSEEEKDDFTSGFIDPQKLKFIADHCEFYLKQIILVRHGEANSQEENCNLTEKGRNQANQVAAFLCSMGLEDFECFSSTMARCVQTAEIISKHCALKFKQDSSLTKQSETEDNEQFVTRVGSVLDHLPVKSLLISHCDFIRNMAQLALGADISVPKKVANCSTTFINNHHAIWIARELSE